VPGKALVATWGGDGAARPDLRNFSLWWKFIERL
jgi:hypothetical protein